MLSRDFEERIEKSQNDVLEVNNILDAIYSTAQRIDLFILNLKINILKNKKEQEEIPSFVNEVKSCLVDINLGIVDLKEKAEVIQSEMGNEAESSTRICLEAKKLYEFNASLSNLLREDEFKVEQIKNKLICDRSSNQVEGNAFSEKEMIKIENLVEEIEDIVKMLKRNCK